MLYGSTLLSIKLATLLAKEMVVNLESTRRIGVNLIQAGYQLIGVSLQHHVVSQQPQEIQTQHDQAQDKVPESTEYLVHNWLEALFARLQMIVLWHEPLNTLCIIAGLLYSSFLLTYFTPRFYATISIAMFVYNLTKVWFRHIWPEIRVPPEGGCEDESRLDVDRWTHLHPQLMTLAELRQIIGNLINTSEGYLNRLLSLRRRRPINFCIRICSILTCTAYIGNKISGSTIIFCITTALLSVPGIYLHILPKSAKDYIQNKINIPTRCQNPQAEAPNVDLAANESTSLIDSEEDQQDDFVML